jgi:tetratricopeptide (TPR) repeat protein
MSPIIQVESQITVELLLSLPGIISSRAAWFVACIAIALLPTAKSARADEADDWRLCSGKQTTTIAERLNACDALIASSAVPPQHKALAYCDRAIASRMKGDVDRAVTDLEEAVRLDTEHYTGLTCRAYQYLFKGDADSAIADYSQAIAYNPYRAEAFVARGGAYRVKRDIDHAIADYNAAIRLAPDNALAYEGRGGAQYVLKRYDEAIADYTEAIRLDPKRPSSYDGRAFALKAKGDIDRAMVDFAEARRLKLGER